MTKSVRLMRLSLGGQETQRRVALQEWVFGSTQLLHLEEVVGEREHRCAGFFR